MNDKLLELRGVLRRWIAEIEPQLTEAGEARDTSAWQSAAATHNAYYAVLFWVDFELAVRYGDAVPGDEA